MEKKMRGVEEIVCLIKSAERTANLQVPAHKTQQQIWDTLEKAIKTDTTKVVPLYRKAWWGVAAAVLLIAGAFFLFKIANRVNITTAHAETRTIYLPDSSTVSLNAGSTLSYSKKRWRQGRELHLTGEAFFEVKKGNRFTVNTHLGNVQVLGTSFNVRVRNNELSVACKTGKVKVTNKKADQHRIITPGESIITQKTGKIEAPQKIAPGLIDTWREGHFYFDSRPLTEVFEELTRQYNIQIQFEKVNVENRVYSGYFNNTDLEEALQLICRPMGLSFSFKNRSTIIIRN